MRLLKHFQWSKHNCSACESFGKIGFQLGKTKFTLVHAPFPVLEKQAQILGVKLPVKECDLDFRVSFISTFSMNLLKFQDTRYFPGIVDSTLAKFKIFDFDDADKKLLEEPEYYMAQYSADRRQQSVFLWGKNVFGSRYTGRIIVIHFDVAIIKKIWNKFFIKKKRLENPFFCCPPI